MLILLGLLYAPCSALAERLPVPESELDEETKLTLAQAMVGEADWYEPDHVAIAFVLARRWPLYRDNRQSVTFKQYISLYSSTLRRSSTSPRTAWIRALPWGPIEGPFRKHWDRVRALVEAWSVGKLRDPCPHAVHWGGAMDRPGSDMVPTSCGYTRNIFYGHRRLNKATTRSVLASN